MNEFKIQKGNLDTEEFVELSKLFKRVFKKNISIEFLNWYYCENPNGNAISNNILLNQKIIGHYALIPIKINLFNRIVKAGLSVFTAIDEEYRGLYLFNKITNATYQNAKDIGIEFVIGVSNNLSTKLFLRYFKFKLISQLDVKIGVGNLKKIKQVTDFKLFWNNESIKWRLRNPNFKYKIKIHNKNFSIYNDFYKFFSIHMGNFFIKEFPDLEYKYFTKKNFNLLNLWVGLGSFDWKNALYYNLPEKLKPAPLNLIMKNLKEKDNFNFPKKENIEFKLVDFDIF